MASNKGTSKLEQRDGLPIMFFESQSQFEHWLDCQPKDATGAWLKFTKKHAPKQSISKAEAIDSALCFGWIDGQLGKYDALHWLIRFTPRMKRSKWSEKNRTRALELISEGRMRHQGFAEIDAAKSDGRWDDAYAPASTAQVPDDLEAALKKNPKAARFFATLTSVNRYAILYRIGNVKRAETRARKIAEFIKMLERGETLHR